MKKYYATLLGKFDGKSTFFHATFEFEKDKVTEKGIDEKIKLIQEDLNLEEVSLINLISLDE